MIDVTVYTPPQYCNACHTTKMRLANPGPGLPPVPFKTVEADEELTSQFQKEGYSAWPVVKVDLGDGATWSWSGFRYSEIKKLAELIR